MTARFELADVREPFRAVVRATVPASAALDADGWTRLEAAVEDAVSRQPGGTHRQIRLFLKLLNILSVLRNGRRFTSMTPEVATRFLAGLEGSFFLILRRGVWGVRTLAFMGYYGVPENRSGVRYRAALRGWSERDSSAGPWPGRGEAGAPEDHVLVVGQDERDA